MSEEQTKPPEGQEPILEDSAKAHIEKILKEKKNAMEALAKTQKDLELERQAKQDAALQIAKIKGDMEAVIKIKDDEIAEFKSKYESITLKEKEMQEKQVKEYKLSSIKKELIKMGADNTAIEGLLRLSNLEMVKWDDDHKIALGVEDEAKRIKSMLPVAFGVQSARADHGAPASTGASVYDIDSFKNLTPQQRKDPALMAKIYEASGITVKK